MEVYFNDVTPRGYALGACPVVALAALPVLLSVLHASQTVIIAVGIPVTLIIIAVFGYTIHHIERRAMSEAYYQRKADWEALGPAGQAIRRQAASRDRRTRFIHWHEINRCGKCTVVGSVAYLLACLALSIAMSADLISPNGVPIWVVLSVAAGLGVATVLMQVGFLCCASQRYRNRIEAYEAQKIAFLPDASDTELAETPT